MFFCVLLCPLSFLTWYCSFSMTNNFSWHLIVAKYSLYTINSLTEGHQACQKKSRGQGLCGVASAQKWRAKCFKYVNLRKAPGPNGYVFRAWTVQIEEVCTTKEEVFTSVSHSFVIQMNHQGSQESFHLLPEWLLPCWAGLHYHEVLQVASQWLTSVKWLLIPVCHFGPS